GSFANASSRRRRLLSVVRVVSRPGKPTITKAVDSLKGSVLRTESGIRYGSWYSTLQSFSGTASWKSGSTANSFVPKNFRNRKTATGAANAAMRTITFLPFIIIKKRGLSFHSSLRHSDISISESQICDGHSLINKGHNHPYYED